MFIGLLDTTEIQLCTEGTLWLHSDLARGIETSMKTAVPFSYFGGKYINHIR